MKIIVSGCSYSYIPNQSYAFFLKDTFKHEVVNLAKPGKSNYHIIKTIYEYIKNTNLENSYIICQLTFTHRIGMFHDIFNHWYDYQPFSLTNENGDFKNKKNFIESFNSIKPTSNINRNVYDELINFYEIYLKLIYNEHAEFENLLYQIELLTTYVEKNNNKIIYLYWPQLINGQVEKLKINKNFISLYEEYSFFQISKNKNWQDLEGHLNIEGSVNIATELNDIINKINKL